MKKTLGATLLIVLTLFLITACSLGGTSTTNDSSNSNATTTNTGVTTNSNSAPTIAKTVTVTADASGFSPSSITINVADTVLWTNASGRSYDISPDIHPSHTKYRGVWDDESTGFIANGETYTRAFTKAGTYTYHDHSNPSVKGTVIVQ